MTSTDKQVAALREAALALVRACAKVQAKENSNRRNMVTCAAAVTEALAACQPPAAEPGADEREATAWLIERRSIGEHRMWWVADARCQQWGTANQAVRFSRKEDAERIIHGLLAADAEMLIATEHSWLDCSAPAAPATVDEREAAIVDWCTRADNENAALLDWDGANFPTPLLDEAVAMMRSAPPAAPDGREQALRELQFRLLKALHDHPLVHRLQDPPR